MTAAIILSAGKGRRMGGDIAKQYLTLGRDPVIAHSLRVFNACALVDALVWVVAEEDLSYCRTNILDRLNLKKKILLTAGGPRRQDSVYCGLLCAAEILKAPSELVAIHDGARPLVTVEQISACILGAQTTGACILGMPVFDTLKHADETGYITSTGDRAGMWMAQTPQVFRHDLILRAHEQARQQSFCATDDAQLVERLAVRVRVVTGSRVNIKITTADDLDFARSCLGPS